MGSNEIQILSYCTSGISTYSNSTAFFFLTTFYSHTYRLITLVLLCFVGQSIIFILIAQSEHLFDSIIFFFFVIVRLRAQRVAFSTSLQADGKNGEL